MFIKLILLEIKNFFRAPSLAGSILMKIFGLFLFFNIAAMFVGLGIGVVPLIEEYSSADPLTVLCRFFFYALVLDLLMRYMFQQLPTQNIKPFLTLNIKKKTLVNLTIFKTLISFFSWGYALLYIPLAIVLIVKGYSVMGIAALTFSLMCFYLINNFINVLMNGKDMIVFGILLVAATFALLDYYNVFHLTDYSEKLFKALYDMPLLSVIPFVLLLLLGYATYKHIKSIFYLDKGLDLKKAGKVTGNFDFLNKYGAIGTFINNDIKLLQRSKVAKATIFTSVLFLFYGLLMFSSDTYKTPAMMVFLGLFVTGGFQFMFGQNVPSWDSSYYPLMMTQRVPYKEYLKAKWWLMNAVTAISIVLALFYVYWGWEVYAAFFAAGLYNIGVNSQFTLLSGAYNKRGIDLNKKAKAAGSKNSFNMKMILLSLPKLLVPMVVFGLVKFLAGTVAAVASLAILGLAGYLLRDKIFDKIVSLYRKEKYTTLEAFKQTL